MAIAETYQGYKNCETWNVKLWMDNDRGSQEFMSELASNTKKEDKDEWRRDLADALQEWIEGDVPDLGASTYSDLLNAALSEVDYSGIAEEIIREIEENENFEKKAIMEETPQE